MKIMHNVVDIDRPSYDTQYGRTADGTSFHLLTNFSQSQLSLYMKAVETWEGPQEFGLSSEAWGFDEDEGLAFRTDGFGFYVRNTGGEGMDAFWRHFDKLNNLD
jgi:hypothetical protein